MLLLLSGIVIVIVFSAILVIVFVMLAVIVIIVMVVLLIVVFCLVDNIGLFKAMCYLLFVVVGCFWLFVLFFVFFDGLSVW